MKSRTNTNTQEPQAQGFWSRLFEAVDAYLGSLFGGKNSFSQHRITTASKLWNYFDPSFKVLNQKGVCNGLVLDFARHTMREETDPKSRINPKKDRKSYAEKLRGKFTFWGKSSKKFAERVQTYQDILQTSRNQDAHSTKLDNQSISNGNLIRKLKEEKASLIGITFNSLNRGDGGHIIAIRKIKDSNPQSYQVFDPNFGIFDCKDERELSTRIQSLASNYTDLNGEIGISDLEQIVKKSGLLQNKLGEQLEIFLEEGKIVRNKDIAITELQELLKGKTTKGMFSSTQEYEYKDIAAYISAIKPEDLQASNTKLNDTQFTEVLKNSNIPAAKTAEYSKNFALNILNICDITNPTEKLAALINEKKARTFPDLVVKLVEKGADLKSSQYKEAFSKYFNHGKSCAETAIYAIQSNNFDLLNTLSEFTADGKSYNLLHSYSYEGQSLSYEGKSLLKIAVENNQTDLALKMIHAGFTLQSSEMDARQTKTKSAMLSKLGLDQKEYIKIAFEKEWPIFEKEKKLTTITEQQKKEIKSLYRAKIETDMSGKSTEIKEKEINTAIAQIQAESVSKGVTDWMKSFWRSPQRESSVDRQIRNSRNSRTY